MKKITTYLLIAIPFFCFAQVGIGTATPLNDLHIAGTTSTIRIESLNTANQPVLNPVGKLAPAYVTADGDVTISPPGYTTGSTPGSLAPLNFLLTFDNFIPDGAAPYYNGVVLTSDVTNTFVSAPIYSVPFSCPQNALVEVKYGITIVVSDVDMIATPAGSIPNDLSARTFRVYYCIDLNSDGLSPAELSKRYGVKGQAHCSDWAGSMGYPYMNSQGYANIPAGNHTLRFFGEVEDGTNKISSIGFGGAQDFLKVRIYN